MIAAVTVFAVVTAFPAADTIAAVADIAVDIVESVPGLILPMAAAAETAGVFAEAVVDIAVETAVGTLAGIDGCILAETVD